MLPDRFTEKLAVSKQSVKYTYNQYIARCWNYVYDSFDLTIKTFFCDEGAFIVKENMPVNIMMALLCDKKHTPPPPPPQR